MSNNLNNLKTIVRRPQDCSDRMKEEFIRLVAEGGEAEENRVRLSLPYTEALIITGVGNIMYGVSALLRPRQNYIKHLFECAGEPQIANLHSLESCWVSVSKPHRGKGVWRHNSAAKHAFMGNRPYHEVRRVENRNVSNLEKEKTFTHVGKDFHSPISKDQLRLMAVNHDPIFNPKKTFVYM
ncbi:MAG: hypothetical protein V7727_08060 [Sneathiella sp.]